MVVRSSRLACRRFEAAVYPYRFFDLGDHGLAAVVVLVGEKPFIGPVECRYGEENAGSRQVYDFSSMSFEPRSTLILRLNAAR